METTKIYSPKFYKELSIKEKELIYQGAMQMASGCLTFDAIIGGAPAMITRLGIIQGLAPWFVRIATDTAKAVGLIDLSKMSKEALVETDEEVKADEPEAETTSTETTNLLNE